MVLINETIVLIELEKYYLLFKIYIYKMRIKQKLKKTIFFGRTNDALEK